MSEQATEVGPLVQLRQWLEEQHKWALDAIDYVSGDVATVLGGVVTRCRDAEAAQQQRDAATAQRIRELELAADNCEPSGGDSCGQCFDCVKRKLADAEQQLGVLRPGGSFAWKSKYEALCVETAAYSTQAQRIAELEQERDTVEAQYADAEWLANDLEAKYRACLARCREYVEDTAGSVLDAPDARVQLLREIDGLVDGKE